MTTTELLESVRRIEVRTNRAVVAAGIRACRGAGHPARRMKRSVQLERSEDIRATVLGGVCSGRQDAVLYVRQGCLTLRFK